MFSTEDLERIKEKISQLNSGGPKNNNGDHKRKTKDNDDQGKETSGNACPNLTASEILVIAGILTGVLKVASVTIDTNQTVDIVVSGSLRRQTQMEKVMEQIGKCSFEDVIQAIFNGCVK